MTCYDLVTKYIKVYIDHTKANGNYECQYTQFFIYFCLSRYYIYIYNAM